MLIPHEEVEAWISSLATANELAKPVARQRVLQYGWSGAKVRRTI